MHLRVWRRHQEHNSHTTLDGQFHREQLILRTYYLQSFESVCTTSRVQFFFV